MGLKGCTKWKKFLKLLFPECWATSVSEITEILERVDVVVEDLNLSVYAHSGTAFSYGGFRNATQHHVANQLAVFKNVTTYIGTMDDSRHVPQAKKIEQTSRDETNKTGGTLLTPEELERLGDDSFLTRYLDPYSMGPITTILKEKFTAFDAERDAKYKKAYAAWSIDKSKREPKEPTPVAPKLKSSYEIFNKYLSCLMATRERKSDVLRFATKCFLSTPCELIPEGTEIIFDGVVWPEAPLGIASTETIISKDDNEEHHKHTLTDEEVYGDFYDSEVKPCFIRQTNRGTTLQFHSETNSIGEGDIKIAYWAYMYAFQQQRPLWVTCSDTDLIVILLLMMKYIDSEKRFWEELKESGAKPHGTHTWEDMDIFNWELPEIYLDVTPSKPIFPSKEEEGENTEMVEVVVGSPFDPTTTSTTKKSTKPKFTTQERMATREVLKLRDFYLTIEDKFEEMWPGTKDPLGTLCMGMMAAGTDYFKCRSGLGAVTVWKTFCSGGYALLDGSMDYSMTMFQSMGENKSAVSFNEIPVPAMRIDEEKLVDFWRYCYSIQRIAALKKLDNTHATFLVTKIQRFNNIHKLVDPPKPKKNKRKNSNRNAAGENVYGTHEIDLLGDGSYASVVMHNDGPTAKKTRTKLYSSSIDITTIDHDPFSNPSPKDKLITDWLLTDETSTKVRKDIRKRFVFDEEGISKLFKGLKTIPSKDMGLYGCARRWGWNVLYWAFAFRQSFGDISLEASGDKTVFGYVREKNEETGRDVVKTCDSITFIPSQGY